MNRIFFKKQMVYPIISLNFQKNKSIYISFTEINQLSNITKKRKTIKQYLKWERLRNKKLGIKYMNKIKVKKEILIKYSWIS